MPRKAQAETTKEKKNVVEKAVRDDLTTTPKKKRASRTGKAISCIVESRKSGFQDVK